MRRNWTNSGESSLESAAAVVGRSVTGSDWSRGWITTLHTHATTLPVTARDYQVRTQATDSMKTRLANSVST